MAGRYYPRMPKYLLFFTAGAGVAWLAYEALTRNPLWFTQFRQVPASVPERMMQEARTKGWL